MTRLPYPRIRFQYRIATLLLLTAVVAGVLGVWRVSTRSERAVRALRELGAKVEWVDRELSISGNGPMLPPEEQYYSVNINVGAKSKYGSSLALLRDVSRLEELEMWTDVDPDELAVLQHLDDLVELWVDFSPKFDDRCMGYIQHLPRLRLLSIVDTAVTDRGLEKLNPRLEWLLMERTNTSDAGMKHVRRLRRLKWLSVDSPRITDAGILDLATLPALVYIRTGGFSVECYEAFKRTRADYGLRQLPEMDEELSPIEQTKEIGKLMYGQ